MNTPTTNPALSGEELDKLEALARAAPFPPCPMPDCGGTLVGTGRLPCGVETVSCGSCGVSVPATDDATAPERWKALAQARAARQAPRIDAGAQAASATNSASPMTVEERSARPEGNACELSGPYTDLRSLKEQSEAWMAIYSLLNDLRPNWQWTGKNGRESALDTIREFARAAPRVDAGVQAATSPADEREWIQRAWMESNQDLFAYTKAVQARGALAQAAPADAEGGPTDRLVAHLTAQRDRLLLENESLRQAAPAVAADERSLIKALQSIQSVALKGGGAVGTNDMLATGCFEEIAQQMPGLLAMARATVVAPTVPAAPAAQAQPAGAPSDEKRLRDALNALATVSEVLSKALGFEPGITLRELLWSAEGKIKIGMAAQPAGAPAAMCGADAPICGGAPNIQPAGAGVPSIDTPKFLGLLGKLKKAAPGHDYVVARDALVAHIDAQLARQGAAPAPAGVAQAQQVERGDA